MARRIEFLAPVEAMRGNLSGKQALKYPTKNNSAWEAPSDKRSYATNYNTRYVGAKRSADGKKYFAVKQRAAVTNTPAQREAQALLAGSKIIADAMLKDISIIARLAQMLKGYVSNGYNYQPAFIPSDIVPGNANNSLRRYLMRNIRDLTLIPKNKQFVVQPQSGPDIVYNNPWRLDQTSGTKVTNIIDMFVKFWQQLTTGTPEFFYLNGMTGIFNQGDTFNDIIESEADAYNYSKNVLGLTLDNSTGTAYVKLGGAWVITKAGVYIESADTPESGETLYTTTNAPSA